MRVSAKYAVMAAVSVMTVALALNTAPAAAQTSDATPSDTDADGPGSADIVVTGSRIRRPNELSASPILSTSAEELRGSAGQTLGDQLANLPSLRTTTTFTNDNINVLDLRGLGTNRTLVLVNGRRQVGAVDGETSVDVETIPLALLERVDIVTGGASAIYGSDAVSGVVNFITRTDFQGFAASAQGGVGTAGGAGSFTGSITGGTNFNSGRGNIALSAEYTRRERLRNSDRSYARNLELFSPNPLKVSDDDGLPFNILYRDYRLPLIQDGGLILANDLLQFGRDGSVGPIDIGDPDLFSAGNNAANGGSGLALNRYSLIQPTSDRISANLFLNYEFSSAAKLFGEARFVRSRIANATQPTVELSSVSIDNPYLSTSARSAIAAASDPGATSFLLFHANSGLGLLGTEVERDLYRGVVGLKGALSSNLSYEIAYVHGETATNTRLGNSRVTERFENALDAVVDTAGVLGQPGAIVCRATLLAGRRTTGNFATDQCQPVNIFGEGNISAEARNYINTTLATRLRLKQDVGTVFLTGDSGSLFRLPGGPVGFAVGAEYRRESSRFEVPDELNNVPGDTSGINLYRDGLTYRQSATPSSGSITTKEVFAEVSLPIVSGLPLVEELTLDAAYRYADYDIEQVGGVSTWKIGAQYRPLPDLRLRATYGQAVRAPNISELFGPSRFDAQIILDPCDATRLGSGTPNRAANCAALGLPATLDVIVRDTQGTIGQISGNRQLEEETSRSLTVGAVFTPTFVPGLSLSVDYYRIKIRDAIAQISAQQAANLCVDSPSIDNRFCPLITRTPVELPRFPANSIESYIATDQNFSALTAEGIDFQLGYRTRLSGKASLSLRAVGTYVITRYDFPFIEDPDFADQILLEAGDPQWNVNANAELTWGPVKFGYGLRFIGSQFLTSVENVRSVGGRPAQQPNIQDILSTGALFYHDARLSYTVGDIGEFFVSVTNLFDTRPPVGLVQSTSLNVGGSIYDSVGRYATVGLSVRF
ncbi:MAG: TonB-dependent receptor [Sphingopyxis sp.]|nr:TonB-dependent receptor [Sphingopyxis sp.]